ncbi:MAG: hypothetical protein WC966_01150 [Bradymonadales bacterium]|jgi:hypothetical protein
MKTSLDTLIHLYPRREKQNRALAKLGMYELARFARPSLVSLFAKKQILRLSIEELSLENAESTADLIVSLTSYPPRIPTLHITLRSLLNQRVKPKRLILWLATRFFPNEIADLPKEIVELQDAGLENSFIDDDYNSYNKLIHCSDYDLRCTHAGLRSIAQI